MNDCYKLFFVTSLMVLLALSTAFAQKVTVSGKVVTDDTGESLPGVSILERGTTSGGVTDIDGSYTISVNKGATLVYSFIGYTSVERLVGDQSIMDVSMPLDLKQLDEIVVIGYGETRKEDLTGSVVAVGKEKFNQGAISTAQELLIGKVPGLVINTTGGQPGANSTIRIRGGSSLNANNDPLIVIDGMPIDNTGIAGMTNPLSTINPNDIETMTVLKDASATAIYGSRASNGVIIITTKTGKAGSKLKLSYNGNVSVGVQAYKMNLLNGDEYRALIKDRVDNHGLDQNALDGLGTANTDWQNQIFRNAISQDHNVSISGAAGSLPYRVSLGQTNQEGILKNSLMKRSTFNVSLNPSLLNGDLKVSLNAKGAYTDNNFSNDDAISSAMAFDPTQPITNGNKLFGGYTAWTELSANDPINGIPNNIATHNPVARLNYRNNTATTSRYILGGKVDYNLPFAKGLTATVNLGLDYQDGSGVDITDTLASWSRREPNTQYKSYTETRKNSLMDMYLHYVVDLKSIDSKLDITGGYSYQHFERSKNDLSRPNFKDETTGEYIGAKELISKNELQLISFFGRLNYTLKDKYLLTATIRDDGSSRFSKANRWGLFPAVAAAWKINNETFLKDVSALSDLKLRLGWGQTGQQDITTNFYPYLPTYVVSQPGAGYQLGSTFYNTQRPNPYDANIKWETTTTLNGGLDFGFLNGRLTGSVDVYKRTTTDLINEIPIAAGTNFSNRLVTNVGSLENKGVEVALSGVIVSTSDLKWELSTNMTYNQNEITKLTLVDDPGYTGVPTGDIAGGVGNTVQVHKVGYPAYTFYLLNQIYDQNGKPIEGLYQDNTGNGGNVAGDLLNRSYQKKPTPTYLFGISSKLNYKGFDFSFSGRLSLGNYMYNNNYSNMALYQNLYNQSGFTANIPSAVSNTGFANAQYFSNYYLENASFFRMDNMSLGYSFQKLFTEKLNGRVAFTVQNAFFITKYSGLDPEVQNGIDKNIYPRPRVFMLGLNLNF